MGGRSRDESSGAIRVCGAPAPRQNGDSSRFGLLIDAGGSAVQVVSELGGDVRGLVRGAAL